MKSSAEITKDFLTLNPDPLVISSGEELVVGRSDEQWPDFVWCTTKSGKSGWVPLDFIDRHGNTGIARCNYSAAELNVSTGEHLTIENPVGGWCWACKQTGEYGWVPATHIKIASKTFG